MSGVTMHHVNFHTWRGKPIFAHDHFDQALRTLLPLVLAERCIVCPAWEIMPTHIHMILAAFEDLTCHTILQYVKGDTSRAFFRAWPAARTDLGGGHLWRQGYFSVAISSHEQYRATLAYIQANRANAGLLPPVPLVPRDGDLPARPTSR